MNPTLRARWLTALPILACWLAAPARAAQPDSSHVVLQDTVVVSSTKLRFRLSDLATSASVIPASSIRLGTARQTQDVLASVPGTHVMDLTGTETGGVVEARGYASQGTSSHMLVLVDEIPINEFESDRVDWNLIAPEQVERIEFLRGPAAFLYGNASMAGVVNLVTAHATDGMRAWAQGSGGSFGRSNASAGAGWAGPRVDGALSGRRLELDGERDHSAYYSSGGYGAGHAEFGGWSLRGRLLGDHERLELPGPLPDPTWRDAPKTAYTPLDRRVLDRVGGVLEMSGPVARDLELTALGSGDGLLADAIETVVPTPALGRHTKSRDARGELRLHWSPGRGLISHLLFGGEVVSGTLESRYRDPAAGDAIVGAGDVERLAGGVFALAQVRPLARTTLTGGVRLDWLRSSLDDPTDPVPRGPDDDLRAASPTAGVNVELPRGGNAYASYAGSFKAPNLEQLYDQRPYVVDFDGPGPSPPFVLHIANTRIQPQRGDHAEAGVRTPLASWLASEATVYYARSRNEIGFDLANFRLSNIDRSVHYGFEGRLAAAATAGVQGEIAYAWTRATFDGGDHDGHQINTVPEHTVAGRVTVKSRWGDTVTLEEQGVLRQWLDEDNVYPLDDYWVTSLGAGRTIGPLELFGSVRNLFDRRYATLGFVTLDEFGNDLPLRYPAAGRSFVAGLRWGMGR